MAASKSTKVPIGFTRAGGATFVSSGVNLQGVAGLAFTDTAGNTWYLWFDTTGDLRTGDAETVEAAGFNFDSGGTVVGAQS